MIRITAKEIMTKDVLVANADWSIPRLGEFFSVNSISGAPVINEKRKLIGVVSSTDIISNGTMPEKDPHSNDPHEYYLLSLKRQYSRHEISTFTIGEESLTAVGDIMTPVVFNVTENMPVQQIAENMIKNRIHRIFVTNNEKVVGIISTTDMLKVIKDM